MALLTRDAILSADDLPTEDVDVPEWGGTVRVRGLTGAERSLIEATMVAVRGQEISVRIDALRTLRERLAAAAMVDDEGKRLFSDADAAALGQKSAKAIDRIFTTARRLAGMDEDAVKNAEGNSEAGQSAGSGTD